MSRLLKTILFFLLFSFTNLVAQTNIVYQSDFSKDDGMWSDASLDNANYYRAIKDGKFHMEHRDEDGSYITFISPFIDKNKPFSIEYDLIVQEGDQGSVLIQLEGRNKNFYYFRITPGQNAYSIVTYNTKKDSWKTLTKSKTDEIQSFAIKDLGDTNHVVIYISPKIISYEINNTTLFNEQTSSLLPFEYFRNIGINTINKSKLTIDNFVFKQDIDSINSEDDVEFTEPIKLSPAVNTIHSERQPIISHDNKTLYFIRLRNNDLNNDEIYFTRKNSKDNWESSKSIRPPLSTMTHEGVVSVSSDNNTLIVMGSYDSKKDSPFYITNKNASGWSDPKNIEIEGFYNEGESIEACVSSDNKVFIFAIENKDSYGKNDLYVSFRNEDGSYTKPKNMGKTVNSWGWEVSPFLAGDDKTLYFSTDGRPGYGYHDIFVTKRLDNTWTNWTEPVNLGNKINSSAWDTYFTIPVSGEQAYLSSNKEGKSNIYTVKISKNSRPEPVTTYTGNVLNSRTKKPIITAIEIYNLDSGDLISSINSSPRDGSYFAVLNKGAHYSFSAVKEGFYPESINIDLTELSSYSNVIQDLILHPLVKGQIVKVNNISFKRGTSDILDASKPELEKLIELLNSNPTMKIQVMGHTDNQGSIALSMKLSTERAQSVVKYLIEKGVSEKRLTAEGFGGTKPLVDNFKEENRKLNRRVEFMITDI